METENSYMQAEDFSFNSLGRQIQVGLFYVCEVFVLFLKARKFHNLIFFLKERSVVWKLD